MTGNDPKQQKIDLENPAGQQRRLSKRGRERKQVLDCVLPMTSSGASAGACKAVLKILDEHIRDGEAWRIGHARIAAECGLSNRTVIRALSALAGLGLVLVSRTGRSNVYSIDRSAVAFLCSEQSEQGGTLSQQKCQDVTTEVPGRHNRSARLAQQKCQPGTSDLLKDTTEDVSSSSSHAARRAEEEEVGWDEVRKGLADCEVRSISAAIAAAQLRGATPGECLARIAEFPSRGDQEPGGLFYALVEGTWPSSRQRQQAEELKAAAAKRTAATTRLREEQTRETQEASRRQRMLEQRYGSTLDQLRGEQLEALALRAYPGEFGRRYFYDRRGSPAGLAMMRDDLLLQLHQEDGSPPLTRLTRTENP